LTLQCPPDRSAGFEHKAGIMPAFVMGQRGKSVNRVLRPLDFLSVADGTRLSCVLNPWDAHSSARPIDLPLPIDRLGEMSIAMGEILPAAASKPHLHPIVSQVTWVLDGRLRARMKGPGETDPYELEASAGQAILTEPLTFLQLINADYEAVLRVLYVVTPAFVSLPGADGYDDAIVFDQTWEQLTQSGFHEAERVDTQSVRTQRELAQQRILKAIRAR
jgi:hypothetical protein